MSFGNIWHNYWRKTDPIGTELNGDSSAPEGAPKIENKDCTELLKDETKGHGEYWQDERIRDDVEAYFDFSARVRKWHDEFSQLTSNKKPPFTERRMRMLELDKATVSFVYRGEERSEEISFLNNGWTPFPDVVISRNGQRGVQSTAGDYLVTETMTAQYAGGNGHPRWLSIRKVSLPRRVRRRNGN